MRFPFSILLYGTFVFYAISFFFLSFWLRRMSGMSEWYLHTRHGKRIWVMDVS